MTLMKLVDRITIKYADEYAEQAIKLFRTIKDIDELEAALIDLAFDFLKDCMAAVLEYISSEYHIKATPLNEKELEEIFYSRDGKTMRQRIKDYITRDSVAFAYCMYRFLRTEAVVSTNKILFKKLAKHFEYVKIENVYCCDLCMDKNPKLSGWTKVDEVDVDDLPTYHPDCRCVVVFAKEEDIK